MFVVHRTSSWLLAASSLVVISLTGCSDDSSTAPRPRSVSIPKSAATSSAGAHSFGARGYRFVGDPVVQGLPRDGPPTNGVGTTAEIYARVNRRLPGTGRFCALRVDEVSGEECQRARPLHGRGGVCLHAYLGMRPTTPLYHRGQGDRVRVRLDLNKGQSRIVQTVIGYGTSPASEDRRVRRLGCPP